MLVKLEVQSTIHALLAGLLRHMRAIDADCPNFLYPKDTRFKEMQAIIDSYFQNLMEAGVDTEVKHASIVLKDEANALWEQSVLVIDMPKSLLRAVFTTIAKNSVCREERSTNA